MKLIARGVDPAQHERELQQAAARKRENSFAAVAEDFFREKLAGERQGRDVERDMRKEFVAAWGKRPIAEITDEDVLQVIRAVKQRGSPSQARNLLGYARRSSSGRSSSEAMELSPIHVQGLSRPAWSGKSAPGRGC